MARTLRRGKELKVLGNRFESGNRKGKEKQTGDNENDERHVLQDLT